MSIRLGQALTEYLKRGLNLANPNFVLIEGVELSVAEGMARSWDPALPQLAVVSDSPGLFGAHAMTDVSGTHLRNRPGTKGVVLVLCGSTQVADRQSLNLFEAVSPTVLLETAEGMGLLAQQTPSVALEGTARAVREAIIQADPANRPSTLSVATYIDRISAGADPLMELPTMGAFMDHSNSGRIDSAQVAENFALASRLTSDELLRPASFGDIRSRAESVLRRRAGATAESARDLADQVMAQLEAGNSGLLTTLWFNEAEEIFEQRAKNISQLVRQEMESFRLRQVPGSQAEGLPWNAYETKADDLRRTAERQDASIELCALDDSLDRVLFTESTRKKLERLQRDKSVSGSRHSSPEAAIVDAAQQLGGLIDEVEVVYPPLPGIGSTAITRTSAGRILTLACARLRLGQLMARWNASGGTVDGLLLRPADDEDLGDVLAAFVDAGLEDGATLPSLQLKLSASDGSSVQIEWRPDLDDAAMLRAALLFAEAPSLTLAIPAEPLLHAFCGRHLAVAEGADQELVDLARSLQGLARSSLERGFDPVALMSWANSWADKCLELETANNKALAESLGLAGALRGEGRSIALTVFAPLKAQWLSQYLESLWGLIRNSEEPETDSDPTDAVATANGIARLTASSHPAFVRLSTQDQPLLPTSEGRVWGVYGGSSGLDESGFAGEALSAVVTQLLTLQPEAAGHLRCIAWGPGAADLFLGQAVHLISRRVGKVAVGKIEVFCIGDSQGSRPRPSTLALADDELKSRRDALEIRYIDNLSTARDLLLPSANSPAVHLAIVTGLTGERNGPNIESAEVDPPAHDDEVLFSPRVWQRPKKDRRMLLMPPAATRAGHMWLRLQNAIEDAWPEDDQLRVPEVRTGTLDIAEQLQQIHALALWVATLDRYATRDSLEQALGEEKVAILHQQKRLGGDSPLSLVLSQKSGGPADRAIGRSLRLAGIVKEAKVALEIGTDLRRVASQGYGILALQAATSGSGINELVGHVVAFSLLATAATPWPLPAGCRVLLISLDEYRHWFRAKRADLLAIALDTASGGVHVAVIEVKARRSDEFQATESAYDQLRQTILATKWAAYPESGNVHSRLWLNRIAEAAYAVARESRFKLDSQELAALENFRLGRPHGSLEWAGLGLVFGPINEPSRHINRVSVADDIVPVVIEATPLTEDLLRSATATSLSSLRTVASERLPLPSNRIKRRPESQQSPREPEPPVEPEPGPELPVEPEPGPELPVEPEPGPITPRNPSLTSFVAPLLGWDASTGEEVHWHPAGPGQRQLQNGHTEIWGSSGMGKTQFTMCLLAQLSHRSGSHFGIADFKNDYSGGFPAFADAKFIDLWDEGAPYNPMELESNSDRAITSAVIELRETVEEALKSVKAQIGPRQRGKLGDALTAAYKEARRDGRWPTMRTLDDQLDEDLAGLLRDLTSNDIFKSGQPLGDVIDENIVFGLSRIPGNGKTTILAAGFIFSALKLRVQNLPPVPNTIRYLVVVDEAHRVSPFTAVQTMIREGRSKGLAVLLATQGPSDLPDVVAHNAQTKICFGLPEGTVATMAARKLQPNNPNLAEQIRTLGRGEAFVSFAGEEPRLLRMVQAYRDGPDLGLPSL